MGVERSFFTPISFWRVLCEWSAVVTAPLMLPSSHDLSLHLEFRHCRQSTVVAFGQGGAFFGAVTCHRADCPLTGNCGAFLGGGATAASIV